MKTAEPNLNTNEITANAQEESLSTKRKSSDPYIIPWEDGEPFKLSSSHLEKIVSNYKALSDNKGICSYLENFFIDEIEFDVREGRKENSVYIKISEKNLFIRCSCKAKVEHFVSMNLLHYPTALKIAILTLSRFTFLNF